MIAPDVRPVRYRCTCGAVVIAATDRTARRLMGLHYLDVGGAPCRHGAIAPPRGHRADPDPMPARRTSEVPHA